MQLFERGKREGGEADWVSFPNFRDWCDQNDVFEAMTAHRYQLFTLTGAEGAESLLRARVYRPAVRRPAGSADSRGAFAPGDDRPGRERVEDFDGVIAALNDGLAGRRRGLPDVNRQS